MYQSKSLKKKYDYLFKKITWPDLIVFLVLFLFDSLIATLGFWNANLYIKIVVFFILLIPILVVLKFSYKYDCRVYMIAFKKLLFYLRKKKYHKNETTQLFVYNFLDQNGILISGNYKTSKNKAKILSLSGNSIFKYDNLSQENIIETLSKNINNIKFPFSIVKVPYSPDFEISKLNLEEKINKTTKIASKNYLLKQKETLESFGSTKYETYFLVIYGSDEIKLQESTLTLKETFMNSNFIIKDLNTYETLKFMNAFYSFEYTEDYLYSLSQENIIDLNNLFKFEKLEVKPSYIKADDHFYSIQAVSDYEYELSKGWMNNVYDSNSIVIWNISMLDRQMVEKLLTKSNIKIKTLQLDANGTLEEAQADYEYKIFYDLISKVIKSKSNNLFDSSIMIFNRTKDAEELHLLEKQNAENCNSSGLTLNSLKYEQFKGFNAIQLIPTHLLNKEVQTLSENIIGSWPWNLELLDDGNDFVISTQTNYESPFLFDLFKKTSTRINSNLMVLGASGSGKSTITKKLLLNQYFNGNKVIIIDPQKEYKKIADLTNGDYIDLANGFKTKINPLQIHLNLYDDIENISITNIVDDHIDFVISWFSVIFPEITNDDKLLLFKALHILYTKFKFYQVKDLKKLDTLKTPIITDLIKVLKKWTWTSEMDEKINSILLFKLIDKLSTKFEKHITYKNLFNVESNIDLSNDFIVFDTKALNEINDKNIANAQFLLLMKTITNNINTNFFNKSNKNIVICIDEAHMYLKNSSKQTQQFILSTVKTIRKFNGSIILTSQNIQDIPNEAIAIIDNIQYFMFFNANGENLEGIDRIFRFSGGLTEEEIKFIAKAKRGQYLFVLGKKEHYQVDTYYNTFEKDILFDDVKPLLDRLDLLRKTIESMTSKINNEEAKQIIETSLKEFDELWNRTTLNYSNIEMSINALSKIKNAIANF